jgi:Secretion system C-terminal sorting domain
MKLKITILLLLSIFNLDSLLCQSWQWGQSGGGGNENSSAPGHESVYKMGTDAKGNLYVAWIGFGGGTKIGGDTVTGANGDEDCMISKFNCAGVHQWTKVIGNDIFGDGFFGFGVDSLGNTYANIAGYDDGFYGFNIDIDTTFLDPIHNLGQYSTRWWMVKYDSAGVFQWFKAPESDTATTFKGGGLGMEVMPDGTFYQLCSINSNVILNNNYPIQNAGFYILKFDNQGNIVNHTPVPIKKDFYTYGLNFQVAKNQTRFYLTSSQLNYYIKDTVGNTPIQGHSAICAFDMQGNQLWVSQFPDTGDLNNPNFLAAGGLWSNKILSDDYGNIYFSAIGTAKVNNTVNLGGALIFNDTNKNYSSILQYGSTQTIVKLNPNSNVVWVNNEFRNTTPSLQYGLGINNQKLIQCNPYLGELKKGNFNFYKNPSFLLPNYYLLEIDINSGVYTKADSLICQTSNPPNYVGIGDIHSDNKGQFYIGGQFPQDIVIAGTTFNAIGGKSDMFIAKWGDTCGANLLSSENLRFKIQDSQILEVYPNPASKEINLSFNQNATLSEVEVKIYDMMGKKVYSEKPKSNFSNTINTSQLTIGMYNVVLNSNGKLIASKKLIIER